MLVKNHVGLPVQVTPIVMVAVALADDAGLRVPKGRVDEVEVKLQDGAPKQTPLRVMTTRQKVMMDIFSFMPAHRHCSRSEESIWPCMRRMHGHQ